MSRAASSAVRLCVSLWFAAAALPALALAPTPEPTSASVAELQAAMAAGQLSSHQLTEHYLRRIAEIDDAGPMLNAVIEINPDALRIADEMDAERKARGPRGPLHGIPVLLKDNIDTADRMLTTAGSLALTDAKPREDAFLVMQLRDAGVVILGKTNLSEWANFRSMRSSSGWSGRGGQTRNPYETDRNPCGSSSGSGAAVAAGLAAVAVGTETDGSIVCPSAVNGIVGIKPTLGMISRSGIIPISASQDTAGPMARSVADAAALLGVLVGNDPDDPATEPLQRMRLRSFDEALQADGLKGARIGVARNLAGFHEGVDEVFAAALWAMRAAGATIVDSIALPQPEALGKSEFQVLLYEFKDGLNRYLATRDGGPRTLAALIDYNRQHARKEMPYFGQELFEQAQAKGGLDSAEYKAARAESLRLAGAEGIDAVVDKYQLDAIVAPTVGAAWTTDLVNGDHILGGGASTSAAVAGYPHVTVPAGLLHGLPVGVSFIGPAWSDATQIRLAYAFEQATHARRAPTFASAPR
jgi:amidase